MPLTEPLIEPPTIGEVFRRLDRLETTLVGELHSMRTDMVQRALFDQVVQSLREDIAEIEQDVQAQAVTRRQIFAGAFLLVLGEILAIGIALSNLAARTSGLLP